MPPRKPHWVRAKDLLFPGALIPITLLALSWTWAPGAVDSLGVVTGVVRAALAVAAAGAVLIYVRVLWRRRTFLAPFVYIRGPFYAVMLHPGSYMGALEPRMVVGQFFNAFDHWGKAFSWEQIRDFADNSLFWVWLKPNLAGSCGYGDKMTLPGFFADRSHKIVVSYRRSSEPLHQTTFQHELGHVIQGALTGSWSVEAHHDRAAQFGLR